MMIVLFVASVSLLAQENYWHRPGYAMLAGRVGSRYRPTHSEHAAETRKFVGVVKDRENLPISNATLRFQCRKAESESCYRTVITDDKGVFDFEADWRGTSEWISAEFPAGQGYLQEVYLPEESFYLDSEALLNFELPIYTQSIHWLGQTATEEIPLPVSIVRNRKTGLLGIHQVTDPRQSAGNKGFVRGLKNDPYSVFARHPEGLIWWVEDFRPPKSFGGGKFEVPQQIHPQWILDFDTRMEPLSKGKLRLVQGQLVRDVDIYQPVLTGEYLLHSHDPFVRLQSTVTVSSQVNTVIEASARGRASFSIPDELDLLLETRKNLGVYVRIKDEYGKRITDYFCQFRQNRKGWDLLQIPPGQIQILLIVVTNPRGFRTSPAADGLLGAWKAEFMCEINEHKNIRNWERYADLKDAQKLSKTTPLESIRPWEYWEADA